MTGPWWAGLPAAETRLDCGGQPHRLRWDAGQLHALDHTADLAGEQILSALGGQSYPCLDVLDLWAGHAADLRVLILASRGPADPLATWTPPPSRRAGYTGGGGFSVRRASSYAVLSHGPPDDPDDGLIRLFSLGGLLRDRLAATVIAAWTERLRGPAVGGPAPPRTSAPGTSADDAGAVAAARPALHAALYGRAVTALRSWTGQRDLAVALTMIPEDQPPRLARDRAGLAAELPFGWLADVWARDLTTCWGRFCLTAAPQPSGDGWLLSTVGLELDSPRPVSLGGPPAS
jgi:hypothetical protein